MLAIRLGIIIKFKSTLSIDIKTSIIMSSITLFDELET